MKTILILRHGKSDWSDAGQEDINRPLAKRGKNDVPLMGEILARFDCVPDKIITSPALRARQTAELVAQACGYRAEIQEEDGFYGGSSADLLAALQHLPAAVERPLLIGHNPILEATVAMLCAGAAGPGESWAISIPTAGLVCLDADVSSWDSLSAGSGTLRWFLIPKLVKAVRI